MQEIKAGRRQKSRSAMWGTGKGTGGKPGKKKKVAKVQARSWFTVDDNNSETFL